MLSNGGKDYSVLKTLNHYSVQEYHTVWELNLDKFVIKIKNHKKK